eukprot:363488-Chlamydomonas_euryale.AAC.13
MPSCLQSSWSGGQACHQTVFLPFLLSMLQAGGASALPAGQLLHTTVAYDCVQVKGAARENAAWQLPLQCPLQHYAHGQCSPTRTCTHVSICVYTCHQKWQGLMHHLGRGGGAQQGWPRHAAALHTPSSAGPTTCGISMAKHAVNIHCRRRQRHPSILSSIQPAYPCVRLALCPSVHLPIHPSFHPSTRLHLSTHLAVCIRPPIQPSASLHRSTRLHPSTHLSICICPHPTELHIRLNVLPHHVLPDPSCIIPRRHKRRRQVYAVLAHQAARRACHDAD